MAPIETIYDLITRSWWGIVIAVSLGAIMIGSLPVLSLFLAAASYRKSADSLILQQRPWMKRPELEPIGTLKFDRNSNMLSGAMNAKIKNIGKSPAIVVLKYKEILLENADNWPAEVETYCDFLRASSGASDFWGTGRFVVFPDDEISFEDQALSWSLKSVVASADEKGAYSFLPMVVGCITYRSVSKIDTEIYQTGFVATVSGKPIVENLTNIGMSVAAAKEGLVFHIVRQFAGRVAN